MKFLLLASLTGLIALMLLTWHWFLRPNQSNPSHADAIVVFAGGDNGERFRLAMQLVDEAVSSTVIVNTGLAPWPGRAEILHQCQQQDLPYQLICLRVESDNTAGEAREFAQAAQDMGLHHLLAVTSDYHLMRASTLLGQCHDGPIDRAGPITELQGNWLFNRIMINRLSHEWGGLLFAWTIERFRNCPHQS